jgi:polyisoprenoid-binding protein YceI
MSKSSVEVTISTASVNTKHEKRDGHLKSPEFLSVEEYPTITFKSTKVMKHGDGFVAVGDLTIRGVTKTIELPFVINGPVQNPWGQTVMGIESEYKLNRHDYGVSWSQKMDNGGLVVADDVTIELQIEATKS